MNEHQDNPTRSRALLRDPMAAAGICWILLMVLAAVSAPFLANSAPLIVREGETLRFPAFCTLFFTESPEIYVEKSFNFLLLSLLFSPAAWLVSLPFRGRWKLLPWILLLCGVLILFLRFPGQADRTPWREKAAGIRKNGGTVIFPPVRYNPWETAAHAYLKPEREHPMGTDHTGRDVFARMVYGARVSVSVGFASAFLAMVIGTLIGMYAGYKGGRTDLAIMRGVEMMICFPQFLLLLILMSILLDYGSRQSVLLLIAVIGLFGWTGLCRLVRGETLKQRSLPYIAAAEGLGVSTFQLLTKHLLPNVSGPIFAAFAFDAAGGILAESWLSFLGFGVQDPAASWGELMRQAFPDPMTYWHLTLWPGLAIFLAVSAFHFAGEGIRKIVAVK